MTNRISKNQYYLDIAKAVSQRSTCLQRKYGAVIVNHDQIISTGYCGPPRKIKDCTEIGRCLRRELKIPPGTKYELCRSVHAEQNAIIQSKRLDTLGGLLYLVGIKIKDNTIVDDAEPCKLCKRFIINAGIDKVYIQRKDKIKSFNVEDWVINNLGELNICAGKIEFKKKEGYQ